MTVGKKFALTSGGLVAVMVLVGVISIYNLARLNQVTQLIISDPLPGMDRMAATRAATMTIRGDVWRHISEAGASKKAEMERSIEESKATLSKALQEYEPTITTAEDRALFEKLKPALQRYLDALPGVLALSRAGKSEEASNKYDAEALDALNAAKELLGAEIQLNRSNGEKDAAESQQTYGRTLWLLVITLVSCALAGAGAAFAVIRNLNRDLRQIAGEMGDGAEQVAAAASQVSSSSQSLAQGSSEQAASIEQTSASSEEINSMSRKNAENSKIAADNMVEAAQRIEEANRNLEQMVTSMNEINASSDKISKIIKVIDEIAFQTNILALNAAVEAARAGEAGMGFAVVADEVRNLAQRCAQAAKDTAGLIEESISKSNDGKTKLDQVATAVGSITDSATKVKTLVDEVRLGSEEQARGIEQVAKAITQMEKVTQTTAANAEESASASEELSAQSDTLRAIVARLNGLVGGGSDAGHSVSHAKAVHNASARKRSAAVLSAASPAKPINFHQEPAPVSVPGGKNSFPLEDDFKEF